MGFSFFLDKIKVTYCAFFASKPVCEIYMITFAKSRLKLFPGKRFFIFVTLYKIENHGSVYLSETFSG
jgi:hypothetical protein